MHDQRSDFSLFDDETLCQMVCQGSDPAFEEISRRYSGLIRMIAKEFSYPGFDSGDFMQVGLMGLFGACKNYRNSFGISFRNFAVVCIKRRYYSLVRSLSAQKNIPADAMVSIDDSDLSSQSSDPGVMVSDKESDVAFFALVKKRLSDLEFCVLQGYLQGASYKRIAENLGVDEKCVDNALSRVRKKLLNRYLSR
ncbi:MAG: sigma-70 family RNA polymerase sigma factor [Ruminococcaceae bacterium]|nr:sigma-70 family RNA polymerase sigma factor [Oscillospiraceae bacterium]